MNADTDVEQSWRDYVQQKEEDLKELIESENLKPEETEKFIEKIQAFFERYFGL